MTTRPWLAAFAALSLLMAAAGCSPGAVPAEAGMQRAREAIAQGDLAAARAALAPLRDQRLQDADELIALAALLTQAGEAPQAIWLLESGLRRFPDRDDLRIQLGTTALVVGNPVLADGAVAPINRYSDQHLDALLLRSRAALELGDLDRALGVLAEAETRYPDDPKAAASRIVTLVREGRLEEAAAAIEGVRSTAGFAEHGAWLDVMAAQVELAGEDPSAALRRLEARLATHPDDTGILDAVVRVLAQMGRGAEGLERVEARHVRSPNDLDVLALLARVRIETGHAEAAEEAMRTLADTSDSPSAALLLSQFQLNREQPEQARQTLERAIERFPDSPMLRMHHAESLIGLAEEAVVRRHLREFEDHSPDDPHVLYLQARLALETGDPEWTVKTLRLLLPRLDRAYTQYWLGRGLEETGDLEGAARRYGLASLRDPTNPAPVIALLRLAEARADWRALAAHSLTLVQRAPWRREGYATGITALAREGSVDQASALARLYAARFPDEAEPQALLAFALRSERDFDAAESVLVAAMAKHAPDAHLSSEWALLQASRGDADSGLDIATAALAEHPESARLHATEAALRFAGLESEAGAKAVDRSLELDPGNLDPLLLRARYYAARGEIERAQIDCDRLIEHRPRNASLHFLRGVLLTAGGQTEAAIAAYRRSIELDERSFGALNNLALLLEAQGEAEKALDMAQQAYALAEDDPDVIDTLGWLYWRRGLGERAVGLLERAHELAPEAAGIQLHLAVAYRDVGRLDEARIHLDGLLAREGPESPVGSRAHAALQSLGS